jgi:hypothetical protein
VGVVSLFALLALAAAAVSVFFVQMCVLRFKEGIIYTNVSSILVSVNPFKLLPLYTPEIMDKYRVNSREQPPHVFQVIGRAAVGFSGLSPSTSF